MIRGKEEEETDIIANMMKINTWILGAIVFLTAIVFFLIRQLCLWFFRINEMCEQLKKSNEHLESVVAALDRDARRIEVQAIEDGEGDSGERLSGLKISRAVRIGDRAGRRQRRRLKSRNSFESAPSN